MPIVAKSTSSSYQFAVAPKSASATRAPVVDILNLIANTVISACEDHHTRTPAQPASHRRRRIKTYKARSN